MKTVNGEILCKALTLIGKRCTTYPLNSFHHCANPFDLLLLLKIVIVIRKISLIVIPRDEMIYSDMQEID